MGGVMFMKRMMVAAVGFLLLGSTPLVAGSTASADQAAKVIDIKGGDSFQPNAFLLNTFHFAKDVYLVKMISDLGIENQKLIVQ